MSIFTHRLAVRPYPKSDFPSQIAFNFNTKQLGPPLNQVIIITILPPYLQSLLNLST